MTTRNYLTFWEALELKGSPSFVLSLDKVTNAMHTELGIAGIVAAAANQIISLLDDTTTKKLFTEYIWPEFQQACIMYVDVEHGPWEQPREVDASDVTKWFREHGMLWVRWLRESKERYLPLITNLTAIQSKLMDRIGSQSVTLFNDTPQNGGDFTTDPYTTNATKSTTETDGASPIARLKEVQDLLRNYYGDWANEFSRFIIYSAE